MKLQEFEELVASFSKLQVCSFDAGGGNVLAHLVHAMNLKTSFVIGGPSLAIYTALFPELPIQNSNDLHLDTDLLISSTGWQSSYEFEIMELALSRGIPVIAVLDHWVNYKERFEQNSKTISPTYLLAFDDESENRIRQEFQNPSVIRCQNFYMQKTLQEIRKIENQHISKLFDFVFIGEPLSRSSENVLWTEYDAIKYFFMVLRNHGFKDAKILVKPHPSEEASKYNEYVPNDFKYVRIETDKELPWILALTDTVVGCHSMALYIAELNGNKVHTALPDGIESKVPLEKAIPLKNLVQR
jgi:hypothetical protein